MTLSILAASLLMTLLVIALIASFFGGVCHIYHRYYYCPRCGLYYDDYGLKTTVPPDRLSVRTICCEECLKKGNQ